MTTIKHTSMFLELLTCDEVKAFISLKIQRCFEQDSSSVDFFKQETKSIVDVICLFVAKQEIAGQFIILKSIFLCV